MLIPDDHPDYSQTGLKGSAVAKLDKLLTIAVSILHGELGELTDALMRDVDDRLRFALEL